LSAGRFNFTGVTGSCCSGFTVNFSSPDTGAGVADLIFALTLDRDWARRPFDGDSSLVNIEGDEARICLTGDGSRTCLVGEEARSCLIGDALRACFVGERSCGWLDDGCASIASFSLSLACAALLAAALRTANSKGPLSTFGTFDRGCRSSCWAARSFFCCSSRCSFSFLSLSLRSASLSSASFRSCSSRSIFFCSASFCSISLSSISFCSFSARLRAFCLCFLVRPGSECSALDTLMSSRAIAGSRVYMRISAGRYGRDDQLSEDNDLR
jgi:hypothetical protein